MNVLRELRKFKSKNALAKIRILILLAVMLVVSIYAWFYTDKNVGVGNIRGVVTEWDVEYSIDDAIVSTEDITVACDEFFPGMQPFSKVIKVTNKTEIGADVEYVVKSVKIFGEEKIDELILTNNVTTDFDTKTTNVFSTEDYPFNAGFIFNEDHIDGIDPVTGEPTEDSSTTVTVFADWSYTRSGAEKNLEENDDLDTYYGEEAYEYYQNEALAEEYSPLEIVIQIKSTREGFYKE